MFDYQQNLLSQCQPCPSETFAQLIVSDAVVQTIAQVREAVARDDHDAASRLKRRLPGLLFQCTMMPSESKRGRGTWRRQTAARLNGLYVLDVDHLTHDPREVFAPLAGRMAALGVVLAFVTASGRGLKFVAKARVERGALAQQQQWLAQELGLEYDTACKNADRLSFCPSFDDILFSNYEELFTYNDEAFDEKYGPLYRSGHGSPAVGAADGSGSAAHVDDHSGVRTAGDGADVDAAADEPDLERDDTGKASYRGVSYDEIQAKYWEMDGGRPCVGERHTRVLALAGRLRYICDNNPAALLRVIDGCGLGGEELRQIVDSACAQKMASYMPRRLRAVLDAVGIQGAQPGGAAAAGAADAVDYAAWWRRLRPLLCAGLAEAVEPLRDEIKMGGVMAAGAMFGTYLTRTWWRHYDGEKRRLSFLVYVIGGAASGKSFTVNMDRLIMEPMRSADAMGREWERQYKEDKQKRSTSSQAQKAAAQEIKHPVIRYVPSTISNAMFYRRLQDAQEQVDGETMHLHLYTCEAELATALRAQQGSWAGKLDLECKSFQNEYAGVDYANEQSVNGVIEVNWNQVISGTPDAMARKIRPATVLDGLVTRLAIFPMPDQDYSMIDRKPRLRNNDAECRLRQWGLKLEKIHGELKCERLVDAAYDWCDRKAKQAALEEDRIMDYFRKRIPFYIVRYGLVHAVLRDYDYIARNPGKPLRLNKQDVDFGLLLGEFIYDMQVRQYGQWVDDALDAAEKVFTPRQRSTRGTEAYDQLPDSFTVKDVQRVMGNHASAASHYCQRLQKQGFVKRTGQGKFKKIIKKLNQ